MNGKAVEELAARMRKMGFSNLVSKVWPETRHESLNDINRDEVTADFIRWAKRVVSERSVRQPTQRTNSAADK